MKNYSYIQLAIALLLTSLIFVTGCSTDETVSNSSDTSILESKISQAESLISNSVEGSEIGQYEIGSQDKLISAVDESKSVINDASASQRMIETQTDRLDQAIDRFKQSAHFEYLESWTLIQDLTTNEVISIVSEKEPELLHLVDQRTLAEIKILKITYTTVDVDGDPIIASGAVMFPKNRTDIPVISIQHGSIYSDGNAPSYFNTNQGVNVSGAIFAATDYAVVMPDYLGYSASRSYDHPYEHSNSLGQASFDMLMAAKEFFTANGIVTNDNLFLTGYSEGGYATMALHRHIEENTDISITMSAPASGAYNKSASLLQLFQMEEEFPYPGSALWVINSYNWIYDLNRTWEDFLNDPYAATMHGIPNPLDYIYADVAKKSSDLYKNDFIQGAIDGSDSEFVNVMRDNDNYNWVPKYPITLYYGTADTWVFPLNSTSAFDYMKEHGANVTQVPLEGKDHFTALRPYSLHVYDMFESMR